MPVDPTLAVPPEEHLDTDPGMIGHVAPDYGSRKHFNTLVVRPELRITMRLGSIEDLCADEPGTDKGRQMRLQLLSYLHEPLNSANIATAFQAVWQWFTGAAAPANASCGLAKTDADIQTELTQAIIEGGALPEPGAQARILLPGSYCFNAADLNEGLGGPVATPPTKHVKYRREQAVWDANPVLGAIPIVVKVEKRFSDGTGWQPAPDITVYFQLRAPDAAAGAALAPAARNTVSGAPPATASNPDAYVQAQMTANAPTADDPQVDNCHHTLGGTRGKKAAGLVLEIKMADGKFRPGFYRAHDARNLAGRPPFYNEPEEAPADGNKHLHALRAKTNANGEAGFIFKPSRTGGDRYKLRAYVGPPSRPSDGTDPRAVMVETGTLVVWRRIRCARYLVWDYPATYAQPAVPATPMNTWTQRQHMDFRINQMGQITLATVAAEYNKGYIDFVTESTAARTVLTAAEWTAARNHALSRINMPAINLQAMLPSTNNTPHMFPLLDRVSYNSVRNSGGGAFPAQPNSNAYWNQMSNLLNQLIDEFVHYFTRDGVPFVVLQSPFGDSLTFGATVPGAYNGGYLTTSGQATGYRGCHLWWGTPFYNVFAYPAGVDHNTVHESGHCHYGAHHWTSSGPPLSGGVPTDHDRHDFCIMGYLPVPGDFCGRCLLKLRGWDVAAIAAN